MHDEWLRTRLLYLRGLKAPNDYQQLLLLLVEIPHPTPEEERKLAALVRAEKAADRAQKARANAARVVNADKLATRKARDRELYNSAGLLILTGLVDTRTGRPVSDRGELLGALLELAAVPQDELRRKGWKRAGDALLADKMKD